MTSTSDMRKLMEAVARPQPIFCVEHTADDAIIFIVDSEDIFDKIVEIEQYAFNEAEHWGGMDFNVNPFDIESFNDIEEVGFDISQIDMTKPHKIEKLMHKLGKGISRPDPASVNLVYNAIDWESENIDEEGWGSVYQDLLEGIVITPDMLPEPEEYDDDEDY